MKEQVVVFQLADQVYGLEINYVREIIRLQPLIHLPQAPEFVAGVISLRQKVIPVIDLRRLFGLATGEEPASARIIILDTGVITAGIKVDAMLEVLRLEKKSIEAVPAITGAEKTFLSGVGRWQEKLILLLDGNRLFKEHELKELTKVTA